MEPLTKLALNNQIVSMRHNVRKSKVYTINKLSREVKKLRAKKGSEEQISKNKKKADRFVNELMVIKKLKDDDVTKYALQNEVPAATILNSIDITIETRARARLAGHKFIVDAVESFRDKFPDWNLCLLDLLNELGAKSRAKRKPNEKKTVKVKKESKTEINKASKNIEVAQSESEDSVQSEGYETDSNKSDSSFEETETEINRVENLLPIENNTSSEKNKNNKIISLVTSQTKTNNESKNNISEKTSLEPELIETQLQKNIKKRNSNKFTNNSNSDINDSNSVTNNSNCDIDVEFDKIQSKRKAQQNLSNRVDSKKRRITSDEIKPVLETVDSFFMTADDKDYMSVYKPPPIVEKNLEERPKIEYPQQPRKEIFLKGKKVTVGKQSNAGNRRERRQQQVEEQVDTTLHPSWEAKRKQKSLVKFEGKKITFDDQD